VTGASRLELESVRERVAELESRFDDERLAALIRAKGLAAPSGEAR